MESAYAAYVDGVLKRIIIINMHEYNYTVNGTSTIPNPVSRPTRNYTISIPESSGYISKTPRLETATLRALHANGSDAISGITYDGYSYNYELDNGLPVRLTNVTVGKKVKVHDGKITVLVEDSGAVMVDFGA